MNALETIESLIANSGENENLHDDYTKNDYVIFVASLFQFNKFLVYCANEKIKFPQVALYSYIIANNIPMCNLCISCGCQIDNYCMSFACLLKELDLINYVLKYDVKPTEKDFEYIMIQKTSFDVLDDIVINLDEQILKKDLYFYKFMKIIKDILANFNRELYLGGCYSFIIITNLFFWFMN